MEIRNIAIIAHVDHGKTTLTDAIMRQTGTGKEGVSMDSNTLELERGITIYSKNAAIFYPSADLGRPVTKINIVDTPGHADFGSEVERVLRSIDCVLLGVDAQEGPMPQTRFVLKKSLELGLKPIVVINKIDKPAADPARCEDQVLNLFFELGANDEQAEFPVVYAIGRSGIAKKKLTDESNDLTPLLETILEHVPSASSEGLAAKPLMLQPFNLGYDNFLGRLAVARVYEGVVRTGQNVFVKSEGEETRTGKITKIFTFNGLEKVETQEASAGDIALVAGLPDIDIGETITDNADAKSLPAIAVDEPTIALTFLVNNSPFAGKEGKYVTSRQLREYLKKELEVNVGLKIDFSANESFRVHGRGELHIAILLENMRRAGYELQVSQPQVIIREIDGVKHEPFEEVIIDTPEEYQGSIIERLGPRGFAMTNMDHKVETVRLSFEGPTRGLLGY
ncbi:MAG: GTP-binding protein, partial [Candidatus Paceibacterota bacterium]